MANNNDKEMAMAAPDRSAPTPPRPTKAGKKAKIAAKVSVGEFEELGGHMLKRSVAGISDATFEREWVAHFAVVPAVVFETWRLLGIDYSVEEHKNIQPVHLLWALLLLKVYANEDVLCKICGCHRDTYRKYAWQLIEMVSYLASDVVSCCVAALSLFLL